MVIDLDHEADPPAPVRAPVGRSVLSRIKLGHVVMVLAALFAFVLNAAVLRGNEATEVVVVAAADIRAGTTLTAHHLGTADVPADDVLTARFLPTPDAAVGQLVTRSVAAGEPILRSDLLPVDTGAGLRAMSIPIEESRAVSGQLSRGDTVDVILVEGGLATYVAAGLEVLDVPDSDTSALGAQVGYSPTIAVDATQALRIAAALDTGEVHVVRSTGAAPPEVQQAAAARDVAEEPPE